LNHHKVYQNADDAVKDIPDGAKLSVIYTIFILLDCTFLKNNDEQDCWWLWFVWYS
jgi:hypothetical protein